MKVKFSNKKAVGLFRDKGIRSCEARLSECWGMLWMSFHHRMKRRHYPKDGELLHDFNQVILVCANCHDKLEKDPKLTRELFEKLRGIYERDNL